MNFFDPENLFMARWVLIKPLYNFTIYLTTHLIPLYNLTPPQLITRTALLFEYPQPLLAMSWENQ